MNNSCKLSLKDNFNDCMIIVLAHQLRPRTADAKLCQTFETIRNQKPPSLFVVRFLRACLTRRITLRLCSAPMVLVGLSCNSMFLQITFTCSGLVRCAPTWLTIIQHLSTHPGTCASELSEICLFVEIKMPASCCSVKKMNIRGGEKEGGGLTSSQAGLCRPAAPWGSCTTAALLAGLASWLYSCAAPHCMLVRVGSSRSEANALLRCGWPA